MNYGLLTHEAANSEKFRAGFPGGWPYVKPVELGESTKLPDPLTSPPWIVVTAEELRQRLETLTPLVNAWVEAEPADIVQRKQLVADIVSDLRAIRQSSGTLTGAQMSNALRRIAAALLILIEEEKVSLK